MKKLILNTIRIICIVILLLFTLGEGILRLLGSSPEPKLHLTIHPPAFFKIDSVLGWRINQGTFSISIYDSIHPFISTVNKAGYRVTSQGDTDGILKTLPRIEVYGCSYTYGFSVPDSSTSCYKLQQMLPGVQVINKGIPAYGLTQMYLLLQESVISGDTPNIAVFNYGEFHDVRTPLNNNWISYFGYAITNGYSKAFKKMRYPYLEIKNDSLQLSYCPFNKFTRDWPLRNHSSVLDVLNTAFFGIKDIMHNKYFHSISLKTAFEIMRYCKLRGITPVFACITPQSTDIIDSLKSKGYYTINYGITIYNDEQPMQYNCGVIDPQHPNGIAHSIYANKIYNFIRDKKLLNLN